MDKIEQLIQKCAVVVNACDKTEYYYEGWNWFFQKNWNKECPWPVYFVTESVETDFEHTINMKIGCCSWKDYLKEVFKRVDSEYVLFTMDDHFFLKPLDCQLMHDAFKFAIEYRQDRMGFNKKFMERQEPTTPLPDFHGYKHRQHTVHSGYLFSLQPSIWRTGFMLQIVEDHWMPWDGEWQGTMKIKRENIPARVSYLQMDGWYGEAYRLAQPRAGDYEMLRKIHDWEKPDHCTHWGNR